MVVQIPTRRDNLACGSECVGHYLLYLGEDVLAEVNFQSGVRLVEVGLVLSKGKLVT